MTESTYIIKEYERVLFQCIEVSLACDGWINFIDSIDQ